MKIRGTVKQCDNNNNKPTYVSGYVYACINCISNSFYQMKFMNAFQNSLQNLFVLDTL